MRLFLSVFLICTLFNLLACQEEGAAKDSLRFIVIGDWGTPDSKGQKLVAKQMDKLAARTNIDFIVTTGDNFYMKGVQSKHDPLWESTFEDIYSLPALVDIPWYVSLGNHDHMGNIYAQIDYGKEHLNWILPETYYSKTFSIDKQSSLQILFLDTSPFLQEYREEADDYPYLLEQNRDSQMAWLSTTLEESDSLWNIVIGHHPVYTAGRHGDTEELKALLPQIFARQKVDAYFAGHDHHLEHYQMSGQTHHFISGGGSRIRGVTRQKQRQFAASSLGFAYVEIDKQCMHVSFINEKGNTLYQTKICH